MKTLRIFSLLLFIAFASHAQIPNASFENWYAYSLGEYPNSWLTSDSVSMALQGGSSVFKGTDPYDGTYSMHLKSVQTGIGIKGPGLATNGIITFNQASFTFDFKGGSPDTVRSRWLMGYYKYNAASANDSGMITVILMGDTAGMRDTIAKGITKFGGSVTAYAPFSTMIEYRNYTRNPDTCLIIIQSSMGINDPNLGVGTELVIDSINFAGTVGIEEANDVIKAVNVYPSPAHSQLNISVELKHKVQLTGTIYDLAGKKALQFAFKSDKENIDISMLPKGTYMLNLSDEKNNSLYSKNFIKE